MTKEKILLVLMAICVLIIIISSTTIKATDIQEKTWTDLKDAKIEIIGEAKNIEEATAGITYKVKISNVTLNPESEYRVYFHYKDENITTNKISFNNHAYIEKGNTEATINTVWINYFLQRNEDIYVSILETRDDTNKIIVTTMKIERPELLPKLGKRFNIFFSSRSTQTFFWAPNVNEKTGDGIPRNLEIKIGKVTDIEILKKVKENKTKGLEQLLDYAKKVEDYNYTGTINYDGGAGITESLTSKMNLEPEAYYFAYIEADTEEGVYYPVEDIALYRAKGTTDLVHYSDKEFVLEIKEEPEKTEQPEKNEVEEPKEDTKTNTIKNEEKPTDQTTTKGTLPQTGEKKITFIIVLVFVVAGIGYIKCKKYQDIK